MPGLPLLHVWQRRGDAIEHALDVHWFQSSILRRSSGECGISPGIVDHDINTPIGLDGRIDQPLHLLRVGDIRRDGMKVDPFQPFRAT